MKSLKQTKISYQIINAIKELHRKSTGKIKVTQYIFNGFLVTKRLKQGCCKLRTLFKIRIEYALLQ